MAAVESASNIADQDENKTKEVDSKREKVFMRRLNAFFDAYGMSQLTKNMAFAYVQTMANDENSNFDRVQPWLLSQINDTKLFPEGCSEWQAKCPSLIPGLRSFPFWDTSLEEMSWVKILEDKFEIIREELLTLNGQKKFQPYRAPISGSAKKAEDGIGSVSHDSGAWNVMYLYLHNMDFSENQECCPVTCAAIKEIDNQYSHAMFSSMAPNTHITKHNGPTNKKLRCHLPLIVPNNTDGNVCRLRVGHEIQELKEGKCIVFDDSYEHESWNDHNGSSRICLIMDVWHPDLSKKEIKFLNFLQNAALKYEKKMISMRDKEMNNDVVSPSETSSTSSRTTSASASIQETLSRKDNELNQKDNAIETASAASPASSKNNENVERFDNFFSVIAAAQQTPADDKDAVFVDENNE